jgi:YHS domain-containing protein
MSHVAKLSLSVLCVLSLSVALGCKKESKPVAPPAAEKVQPPAEPAAPAADPSAPATDPAAPAAEPAKSGAAVTPEIEQALAKLSPEDRALADKQKTCPVSGYPLGSMDTPKKVTVAGQEVFICCEACEQPLHDNPEKFLAVIDLKPAEAPAVQ